MSNPYQQAPTAPADRPARVRIARRTFVQIGMGRCDVISVACICSRSELTDGFGCRCEASMPRSA